MDKRVVTDTAGNPVPTEPMTKHKTGATYAAGLVVSVLASLLARWGFDLGPDATALLLIVLTPLVSAFAAHATQNYKIDLSRFQCNPLTVIAAGALALLMVGCARPSVTTVSDELSERQGLFGSADRLALEAALLSYNDAGVDPVKLDAQQLRWWDLACVTLMLVDPDPVLVSDCQLVRRGLLAADPTTPRAPLITGPPPAKPG